jgi:hypothetical protein
LRKGWWDDAKERSWKEETRKMVKMNYLRFENFLRCVSYNFADMYGHFKEISSPPYTASYPRR